MSRLLHRAYKRLKVENPAGKLHWDEAISTLEKGDHYILVLWGQHSPMGARKDGPGSKVVKYGGMFVAGCLLLAKLANDRRIPTWVFEFFGVLLLVLFLLTMFFLRNKDVGRCAAGSRPKIFAELVWHGTTFRSQNTARALDDLPWLYATRNDPQHRMRPELRYG